MKNKIKDTLAKELKFIGITFILFYVFWQIHYFKESVFVVLKMVFAHFFLFILPGYALCLVFYEKLEQIERFIIGIGVGYGLQPFLVYVIDYFVKINIGNYYIYVSITLIATGLIMFNKLILNNIKQ